MTKDAIKIILAILVIITGSFLLVNNVEAEGLSMCSPFPCSELMDACYQGEFDQAFPYTAYCDYGYCVSKWSVHCYDADCYPCNEREALYIRTGICEEYNSSCSTGSIL